MELVSAYLLSKPPVQNQYISVLTFHKMKRNGWYTDKRFTANFTMLNKRFKIKEQWYRVMVRFEFTGIQNASESYQINLPCPFIVTECQPIENDETQSSLMWKDTKTYHGPRLKSTLGFIQAGIPIELIESVNRDLKEYVVHID